MDQYSDNHDEKYFRGFVHKNFADLPFISLLINYFEKEESVQFDGSRTIPERY